MLEIRGIMADALSSNGPSTVVAGRTPVKLNRESALEMDINENRP